MRRVVLGIVALGLVLASSLSGAALAGKKASRTARADYTSPNSVGAGEQRYGVYSDVTGWYLSFKTKPGEDHVSLNVTDKTGTAVAGTIYIKGERKTHFCGSSDDVRLNGARSISVILWTGACEDDTPSVVTQGTVEAVFSDRI